MDAFITLHALAAPLDRSNVDTDAILPKQFMKSIRRSGFGPNLFDAWRYLDPGEPGQDAAQRQPNPAFMLNQPRYQGVQILLARENFGCGSSREHAVWALKDFGLRAVIAPSFADIFHGNCLKNGLLPVTLDAVTVEALFQAAVAGTRLYIDLVAQTVTPDGGAPIPFGIDAGAKDRLLNGLDEIELTLQRAPLIREHEALRRHDEPWLFSR
jgi:3-isopropylmalate/(R)-2-methylmalate dehydratase small subunit